jgi:putative ABC transport system permease protein
MNRWLNDFAYRIHIGVDIFILSGLTAFGIAVLTVIFQSVKAARINPVEALRCE